MPDKTEYSDEELVVKYLVMFAVIERCTCKWLIILVWYIYMKDNNITPLGVVIYAGIKEANIAFWNKYSISAMITY